MGERAPRPSRQSRTEWPTLGVALAIYVGFGLTTWYHASLPWWAVMAIGGYLVAWHGHLQHEVIHGHPTSRAWLNAALVFPNLGLWYPFCLYRELHLRHHRSEELGAPGLDPESFYLSPAQWSTRGALHRAVLTFHNTLLGRLCLGPAVAVLRLLGSQLRCLRAGETRFLAHWALHVPAVGLTLGWTWGVCGVPPLEYVALYAYPGLSLVLLRSFAEHQAHQDPARRTVVIESGPLLSLLFLNNNLHAVHHAAPGVAWFRLPELYARRHRETAARGYFLTGYHELFKRHLLHPKEPVAYPCRPAAAGTGEGGRSPLGGDRSRSLAS